MSKYAISNKDLAIFLVVTFGLTIGMGIIMAFTYTKYQVSAFALAQMYYPAIGVMIAFLLNNERRKELPMKFYGAYLFVTITSIFSVLVEIFVFHKEPGTYIEYSVFIGSMILIFLYFADGNEKMDRFGLRVGKNMKASIGYIALFVILHLCVGFLSALISGSIKEITTHFRNEKILGNLFRLPLMFPLAFIVVLGEEYGWRYFLQTALQERMGKRKGVILLGFIWGAWHWPLSLFFYNPTMPFYSVINKLIVCIAHAVFFGFVYMKTENIWTVSMIHFLNNHIVSVVYGSMGVDATPSWRSILRNLACVSIVFLPFLFTKEYRKREEKVFNHTT